MTDWKAPSHSTLARIPDRRARQFWDPQHLVAAEIARIAQQKSVQSEPDCCVKKGFHWDEVALYGPHARWGDGPTPVYWNGVSNCFGAGEGFQRTAVSNSSTGKHVNPQDD